MAGTAATRITPDEPVFLAGYASRDRPHDKVADELRAKALALRDREGNRAVWITTDLIGLTAEVAEPVCARICEKAGIERTAILIGSSHTHAGPALTLSTDATTRMDAKQGARQAAYTRRLQDALVEIAVVALNGATEAVSLDWATGVAEFVMNRREPTEERGIVLGVNPRGPVDRSVPVLRVKSGDGKILAVVFQAACHNTTLGGKFYDISGDYAGYAQQWVEKEFPGTQAMFMMGCGGDANPYPRGNLEIAQHHGEALGREVGRVLREGSFKTVTGPLRTVFAHEDVPLQKPLTDRELKELKLARGGWQGWVARTMEQFREEGKPLPTHYHAPFSVWQFGKDLTLVGLSGEVVVDYVYRLEKELGSLNLWISAYCHDVYGYLPSRRVLEEGGYETRGIYSGGIGFFAPEAEDAVAGAIVELAGQAGRPAAGEPEKSAR